MPHHVVRGEVAALAGDLFLRLTLSVLTFGHQLHLASLAIRGVGTSFHPVALRNSVCVTPSGREARGLIRLLLVLMLAIVATRGNWT